MDDYAVNVANSLYTNISAIVAPQDAVGDTIRCFELTDRPHPIDTTFGPKRRVCTSKAIQKGCRPRPPRQSRAGDVCPARRLIYPSPRGHERGLQRFGELRYSGARWDRFHDRLTARGE